MTTLAASVAVVGAATWPAVAANAADAGAGTVAATSTCTAGSGQALTAGSPAVAAVAGRVQGEGRIGCRDVTESRNSSAVATFAAGAAVVATFQEPGVATAAAVGMPQSAKVMPSSAWAPVARSASTFTQLVP